MCPPWIEAHTRVRPYKPPGLSLSDNKKNRGIRLPGFCFVG